MVEETVMKLRLRRSGMGNDAHSMSRLVTGECLCHFILLPPTATQDFSLQLCPPFSLVLVEMTAMLTLYKVRRPRLREVGSLTESHIHRWNSSLA